MSKKIRSGIVDGALRDMVEGKGRRKSWQPRGGQLIPGHRVHQPPKSGRSRKPHWRDYLTDMEEDDEQTENGQNR